MKTISYPSDEFPAPVGVTMDCPDGWQTLPEAAQCLAIIKDVPAGEFRPNVIVTIRRMQKNTGLRLAISELHARAATLTEYAAIGEEERLIDGQPGFNMEGSFIDPTAGTLVQAIRLAAVPRGVVEDLVQVTATCHAKQAEEAWQAIRAIEESLKIQI